MSRYIVSLNLKEVNEIFRRAIIRAYFEPELLKMDYRKSVIRHPLILDDGLTIEDILHLYFDISTGIDYPDGDEWFTIEYLLPIQRQAARQPQRAGLFYHSLSFGRKALLAPPRADKVQDGQVKKAIRVAYLYRQKIQRAQQGDPRLTCYKSAQMRE